MNLERELRRHFNIPVGEYDLERVFVRAGVFQVENDAASVLFLDENSVGVDLHLRDARHIDIIALKIRN